MGQVDSIRAYFLPSVRLSHDLSSWTSPDLEQEQQWMRQQIRQADSEFAVNVWQPMLSADLTSHPPADGGGGIGRSGSLSSLGPAEGSTGPAEHEAAAGLTARLRLGSGGRSGRLPCHAMPLPHICMSMSVCVLASGGEEFLCGLCSGYFLGSLMLFCAWDSNVSSCQRMGIFCGILLHLAVPLLSYRSSSPSSLPASSSSSSAAVVAGIGPGAGGVVGTSAAVAPVTVTVG